jgi:thiosulfate reductase cytochrome b subunit
MTEIPDAPEPKDAATGEPSDAPPFVPPEATETARAEGAPPVRLPGARRHHPVVRITHWLTVPLVFAMIASGLQIYRAYPRLGDRGGPYYPNPLQDVALPGWMRLGGWLAGGLHWHFMLMWPLLAVGLTYAAYMLVSGEWKKLVFRPRDVKPALQMTRYYLRLRRDHPRQGKHNALQKQAYTFILLLGLLSVSSGFAIWKPVQLAWLTAAFGGFQAARFWHFWAVWLFVAFTLVHVILVFAADPASLRGMTTGRYRGRYTSDEP